MVMAEVTFKAKVRVFLMRTLWGTLLAVFLIFMFHYFTSSATPSYQGIKAYLLPLWMVLLINFLFHGMLWLDRRLDRSIPWYDNPGKRLLTEIAVAFPAILVLLTLNYMLLHSLSDHPIEYLSHQRFLYTYIILMIVFGIVMSIVIANNFFHNWRKSLVEVEQLKQEKMKSDYQALQNQLNPHFLFNNFNMLSSEIRRDPDNAVRITETLSDIYRYVLESKNLETVTLGEEAEFVEALLFLHQVRYGDHLVVERKLPPGAAGYRLPPLTLQILVENALKHNVVSAAHPLHIHIGVEDEILVVVNSIQPRKSTYSTGLGLKNIKLRCAFLTERKVTAEVDRENNLFRVEVPLLKE